MQSYLNFHFFLIHYYLLLQKPRSYLEKSEDVISKNPRSYERGFLVGGDGFEPSKA